MPVLTAYKEGCRNYNSLCSPSSSMAVLDVRLSGIDKDDISGATYQLGNILVRATKTLGNGIEIGDDGLVITLDSSIHQEKKV